MENSKIIIYEDPNFECYRDDKIGILKIKKNVFEIITDLQKSYRFIKCINLLEKDDNISAIVIFNEKNSLGNKEYINYLNRVSSHKRIENQFGDTRSINNITRTREHVILNNIISKIVKSCKIIVNASNGEIVTPFFGLALAADLRFATDETIFYLSHSQMNVHPNGALPYFLPKLLGYSKASQILLCSDQITAQEALDLGILLEILPEEKFEEICITEVKKIIARGDNALKCTIKMLSTNFKTYVNTQTWKSVNLQDDRIIIKI